MIKINMDMPKNCFECRFRIPMWNYYKCSLTGQISDGDAKLKPRFCPLRKENLNNQLADKTVYEIVRNVVLYH